MRKFTDAEISRRLLLSQEGLEFVNRTLADPKTGVFVCSEGHLWQAKINSVLKGSGCKKCYDANRNLTRIAVNRKLEECGLTVVSAVASAKDKADFLCRKGHVFKAIVGNVLHKKTCPSCIGSKHTADDFCRLISEKAPGFTLVGGYTNQKTPTLLKCPDGHVWSAAPVNLLRGKGCPECSTKTIWQHKKAFIYIMQAMGCVKIGISYNPEKRRERLEKRHQTNFKLISFYTFGAGSVRSVYRLEQKVHKLLTQQKAYNLAGDGKSEFFRISIAEAKTLLTSLGCKEQKPRMKKP